MEQALNVTREWLVACIMFLALLHQWAHLAALVITVVLRVHSWMRLSMAFLPQKPAQHIPGLQKLLSKEEVSRSLSI